MSRFITVLVSLIFLQSCQWEQKEKTAEPEPKRHSFNDLMANKKVVVVDTSYSQDSSRMLLTYHKIVHGKPAGYQYEYTAIVQAGDLKSNIDDYSIPHYKYDKINWNGNEIDLHENFHTLKRRGKSYFDDESVNINNVKVNIHQSDPLDTTFHRKISLNKYSPDSSRQGVVYQYFHPDKRFEYVHFSVIPAGDSLPEYGNFYISSQQTWGCLSDFRWKGNDSLVLFVQSQCMGTPDNYLVSGRPDIAVEEKLWVQPDMDL